MKTFSTLLYNMYTISLSMLSSLTLYKHSNAYECTVKNPLKDFLLGIYAFMIRLYSDDSILLFSVISITRTIKSLLGGFYCGVCSIVTKYAIITYTISVTTIIRTIKSLLGDFIVAYVSL